MAAAAQLRNSAFSEQALLARLAHLNTTQPSIQTVSFWIQLHRKHFKQCISILERELQAAGSEKILPLVYLVNDVVQNSRKKGPEFVQEFARLLPKLVQHVGRVADDSTKKAVLRVLDIWQTRSVFPAGVLSACKATLSDAPIAPVPKTPPLPPPPSAASAPVPKTPPVPSMPAAASSNAPPLLSNDDDNDLQAIRQALADAFAAEQRGDSALAVAARRRVLQLLDGLAARLRALIDATSMPMGMPMPMMPANMMPASAQPIGTNDLLAALLSRALAPLPGSSHV